MLRQFFNLLSNWAKSVSPQKEPGKRLLEYSKVCDGNILYYKEYTREELISSHKDWEEIFAKKPGKIELLKNNGFCSWKPDGGGSIGYVIGPKKESGINELRKYLMERIEWDESKEGIKWMGRYEEYRLARGY